MIKHIFILVGPRMTGKTVLSNLIANAENVIIFDDVPLLGDIRRENNRRRLDKERINKFEYAIYNTIYVENIEIIANHFKEIPVTACYFKIATIKSNQVKVKKKIGDLTLNEALKIKNRCGNYKTCSECEVKDESCYKVCSNLDMFIEHESLNQEIEVEENE